MTTSVPAALRRRVAERANYTCEYCLFPESAAWLSFDIEHIIAEKHSGQTESQNLALACPECNRYKGSDIGSIDPENNLLTPFFNPRIDDWTQHFRYVQGEIVPISGVGRVTATILRLNLPERILERKRLSDVGVYKL